MVDITAEAILAVEANPENIRNITGALNELIRTAGQAQRAIAAASGPAPSQQPRAQAGLFEQLKQFASNLGGKMSGAFASGVEAAAKAPLDVLKTSTRLVQQSLLNMTGSAGRTVQQMGLTSTAVIGVGVAVAGLAAPLISLVAGFKLMRSSFGWAQQAAEEQMTIAGRARRFFPEAFGAGLEEAEEKMAVSMRTATALIGDGADQLQESLTRRLSPQRLSRGIRGDRDIFSRWGITPQAIARYEKLTGGRIDLTKWLEFFVLKREKLENDIQTARTPQEKDLATRKLATLMDDSLKIFDANFAKAVGVVASRDIVKLTENLKAAKQISYVPGATRNSVEFRIALKGLGATFTELTGGIGQMVQPTVTRFLEALNQKLLPTRVGGEGLAEMFKELAASLAIKAWETLHKIMRQITPDKVNDWIKTITSWNSDRMADNLIDLFHSIVLIGRAIGIIITGIGKLWEIVGPEAGKPKGGVTVGGSYGSVTVGARPSWMPEAAAAVGVEGAAGVAGTEAGGTTAAAPTTGDGGGGIMNAIKNFFSVGKAQASTMPGGPGTAYPGDTGVPPQVPNTGPPPQPQTTGPQGGPATTGNDAVWNRAPGGLTPGLGLGEQPPATTTPRPFETAPLTTTAPAIVPGAPQPQQAAPGAPDQSPGGPSTAGTEQGRPIPVNPAGTSPATAGGPATGVGVAPTTPSMPAIDAPPPPPQAAAPGVPDQSPGAPAQSTPSTGATTGTTGISGRISSGLSGLRNLFKGGGGGAGEPAMGAPSAVGPGPPASGSMSDYIRSQQTEPLPETEIGADLVNYRPQAQSALQGAAASAAAGQMAFTTTMEHRNGQDQLVMKPAVWRQPEGEMDLKDLIQQASDKPETSGSWRDYLPSGEQIRSAIPTAVTTGIWAAEQAGKLPAGTYYAVRRTQIGAGAVNEPPSTPRDITRTAAGFVHPAVAGTLSTARIIAENETVQKTLRDYLPSAVADEVIGFATAKSREEYMQERRAEERKLLGIGPEQEGAERAYGESPYSTETSFEGRFGTWPPSGGGGITAADGTQFGTAAAEALKSGIDGVSIGGPSSTTWGVTPQQAQPPRGGDPPTEA